MADHDPFADRPRIERVQVGDSEVKAGDRVRLWPMGRGDILDMALEGKTALIEAIEQDFEDRIYLAVVVEEDPGKDFGLARQPGHRFFFGVDEIELIGG
jgi:hypothetical protein